MDQFPTARLSPPARCLSPGKFGMSLPLGGSITGSGGALILASYGACQSWTRR
jgi:hypothetical protein